MIPERSLQEIQDRLSIVEVIGSYVSLKKAGRNFKALCPFHPEKTPSFVIYPEKQFFICYGCGAGGDLIAFVMKHEKAEFVEAVEILAEKAGVSVPSGAWAEGSSKKENGELYQAHEVARDFYCEQLLRAPEGEPARAYLKQRGLEPQIWEKFSLGYAPPRWDGLVERAKRAGVSPAVLERSGLAIRREGGEGWYDRFRGRAIFPIWDSRGRVIAFGGRVLEEADGPKYMNSPETELYVKGRVLYGLHLASPHIREQDFCIVVEGYMDVVSPARSGIGNVVASMGTSLTEAQVKLIRKQTRHVVMVYDGDYAGESATLRGLDLFLEAEMRVRVVALPSGFDPDSLIRKQGADAFRQALKDSKELFDYKLGLLTRQLNPKELEGRVRICQEMLPTIKRVPNAIQRGDYIRRLAEELKVAEGLLWTELGRVKTGGSAWRPEAIAQAQASAPGRSASAEDLLAGLLLEDPRRAEELEGRLELEHLGDAAVRQVVEGLMERARAGALPADHREFLGGFPRESGVWQGRFARWLARADEEKEKELAFEDVLERIRGDHHRGRKETLLARLREAEQAGDHAERDRLVLEWRDLP